MKNIRIILIAILLTLVTGEALFAQNDRRNRRQRSRGNNKIEVVSPPAIDAEISDSLRFAMDSTRQADSLARVDSLSMLNKSSLKLPAFTSASDSIVEVFSEGRRLVYYFGGVTVEYQDMSLTADYMEYDMNTGTVYARGTLDSLTGEWTGRPVMKQGKESYEMEELRYNFDTEKAFIYNMITNQQEGELRGSHIKMFPDKSINIEDGKYTVCDADEPHFYLHMTNAKVMTKPSQKTVFGPAWPVVEGIPLFPVVLPFGFIPPKPERATGFLMPTFGEETARGFYVRDAGMYFVIGDHFDLSLTGDIYSLGSWAVDVNSRYKVNYKFSGNFSLTYSHDQTGEKGSPDFNEQSNFAVKWSHSQDSKMKPGTSFSASVNFSSPSNSKYNSRSVTEAVQNQISSSISYSRNWNGKFNVSLNALHSQNSRDSSYSFTLPNISMSMSTIYPFKQKHRVGKEKFYEKFSIGYNASLQNKINFKASEFGQDGFLDKFQNGMTHNFSIGLPNFSLAKYINVTPSVSYGMNWFFRSTEYVYNPETNKPEAVKGKQFGTFGVTQTYSGSIQASTRLYGMYTFGKYSFLQAVRHVVSPSVSVSYKPELGTYANGYRTLYYTDRNGESKEYSYNLYSGQLGSVPGKGQSAMATFSIGNNLEAKVRDRADTTGKGSKKIKLIDQLNFSSGYNFLADSLRWNNIGATLSTNLFEKVNLSANANFDPYAVDDKGKKIDKAAFTCGQGLLRLTNASASLSYSLSGKGTVEGNAGGSTSGNDAAYKRIYYHPVTGEYIPGGYVFYMNPNSPWSINMSYSFAYSKNYSYSNNQLSEVKNFTQTISFNGNAKVTPKLSFTFNTGFDIMAGKLTTTQINVKYDLHCFNIAISWIPTGQWQSYSFVIAANASTLADLLRFKKSTSFWDR